MPARRTQTAPNALARGLADARAATGLPGAEAARRAGEGFSQSKVSRMEAGQLVPSPADVDRYLRALGAPAKVRRDLVARAHDLYDQHKAAVPKRITLRRAAAYQQRVGRIESDSRHVATFHPLLVPGLLQTENYMRAVFRSGLAGQALEDAVAARLDRQRLLGDTTRAFTLITTYGALGWRAGRPANMAAQVEHIANLIERPNLRIGVIPWGTRATVFPPDGFDLYDQRLVIVGTTAATAHITDPRDIERYVHLLKDLEQMAVFGDEARAVLAWIADEYRELKGE